MKRAAAVIGPTPCFVRWAIRYDCPFRENPDGNLPYQTFRQLRNLREVSLGRLSHRIIDGVCIHAEFNRECETARGFSVDEIQSFFGETDDVDNNCGNCPANVVQFGTSDGLPKKVWAGCYGWVPSKNQQVDLITAFEKAAEQHGEPLQWFRKSNRIWYSIWQTNRWIADELTELLGFLRRLPESLLGACPELVDLARAVDSCHKNGFALETELIPRGNSDGIEWRIESHCPNCRCEMGLNERKCGECLHVGHPIAARNRRVLGLRPYLLLKGMFGSIETVRLLNDYHRNCQSR